MRLNFLIQMHLIAGEQWQTTPYYHQLRAREHFTRLDRMIEINNNNANYFIVCACALFAPSSAIKVYVQRGQPRNSIK